MNGPLQDRLDIEERLAEWHTARQDVRDTSARADREKQQQTERDHRIQDEDRIRAKDIADAADRATKAKEDKIKSLIARLECEVVLYKLIRLYSLPAGYTQGLE